MDEIYSMKTILRLFPYLDNKAKAQKLKIDEDSIHYISIREHADQITEIITKYTQFLKIKPNNIVITDATAGVGGNTISFGSRFRQVNSIEIEELRAGYLKNNIGVYNLDNVNVINGDYTKIYGNLTQHVVFIDPPWGGKSYKDHKNLKLDLSGIPIETICNNLLERSDNTYLIVLKLPNNYDIKYLFTQVTSKTIYLHELKKMFILVIVNTKFDLTSFNLSNVKSPDYRSINKLDTSNIKHHVNTLIN